MPLGFDESELHRTLKGLPNRLLSAFAAAAAERQLPNYLAYVDRTGRGAPEILVGAMADLWSDLEGQSVPLHLLEKRRDECESLMADEDDEDQKEWPYAEDAISSTLYALEARLTGGVEEAVWSVEHAISAIDEYVTEEFETITPEIDKRTMNDPLIQAEYQRQRRDLSDLLAADQSDADQQEVISKIRRRAQTDALRFFDRDAASKALGLT